MGYLGLYRIHLFYKIEKNGVENYLVGTLRAHQEELKVSSEMMSAFMNARYVILETNATKDFEYIESYIKHYKKWRAHNPPTHIDNTILKKLVDLANPKETGLLARNTSVKEKYIKLAPMQHLSIATSVLLESTGVNKPGLARLLPMQASRLEKQVHYLNSADKKFEMSVHLVLTYAEQVALLSALAAKGDLEKNKIIANFLELDEAYQNDNLQHIAEVTQNRLNDTPLGYRSEFGWKHFFTAVNIFRCIDRYKKDLFIGIDARHVPDVIESLRLLGYKITPVQQSTKSYFLNDYYSRHSIDKKIGSAVLGFGLLYVLYGIREHTLSFNFIRLVGVILAFGACIGVVESMKQASVVQQARFFQRQPTSSSTSRSTSEEIENQPYEYKFE